MARRGDFSISPVVAMTLAIIVLILLIIIFTDAEQSVSDSFYCAGPDDNPNELQCVSRVDGCASVGGSWHPQGFWGCGKGRMCCAVKQGASAPVTGDAAQPVQIEYIGPAQFIAVDAQSRRTVVEHGTIPVYVEQPKDILLDVDLPPCKDCVWQYEEMHLTRAEERIEHEKSSQWLTAKDLQEEIKNISLITRSQYIGDTITYVLLVTPNNGTVNRPDTNGTVQRFTFRYKVESPVRVTSLSTEWAKSKKVVANCDQSVGCSAIYYTIQTDPEECAPPDLSKAKFLPTKFCLYEDGKPVSCNFDTENSCYASTASTSTTDERLQTLHLMTQSSLLNDSELSQQFNDAMSRYTVLEQQESSYACKLDLSADLGAPYMNVPLNTTMNRERQEATIYLDRQFMSDQYLCVYGQSEDNSERIYTAGKPQLIRIDTVPPVATITFSPLSKKLTFQCTDEESQCKTNYWVQYISDVTKFFPALFSAGSQSAAVWCPPYESASGWRLEAKREVLYTAQEVRVLCLRVEDQAGNAGVTKTIVYDSYEVLAALLAEYGGD